MIFEKIRKSFKDAVSEHYASVIMFLIATILWAIDYDLPEENFFYWYLPVMFQTLMGTATGVML